MPAPPPSGYAPLWDCYATWKPNWNAKSPPSSKPALQQALDDYQPLCARCRLARCRYHRYARAVATGPPATAEFAYRYLCSAAASVTVWPVV